MAPSKASHIFGRSFEPRPIVSQQNASPANGDIDSMRLNRPFDDAPSRQIVRLVAAQFDKLSLVDARSKIDYIRISRVRCVFFRRIGEE